MGVTVISCPKLINSLTQILAFNLAVTRASKLTWARATPLKGSPERVWIIEATDPCTVACASIGKLGELLTGAYWIGVSVGAEAEADWSDTIKGVRDWITACVMLPWLHWR